MSNFDESITTSAVSTAPRSRAGRRMIAALAAGGLFLAACGSDGSDAAEEDTSAETSETTAAPVVEDDAMEEDAMEDDDAMEEDAMEDDAMEEDDAMAEDAMMGAFGPACSAVPADGPGSFAGMAEETAGTAASNNPLLSTLVTAVVEADLVDTLNSEGPFTIFAPTNDAFAAIDPEVLNAVLADKELLTQVLTYHVVGGDSLLAEGLSGSTQTSVEGGDLSFGADGTTVNDVDVICSNVPVANGTVHIIDQVLLPQVALDAIASMSEG